MSEEYLGPDDLIIDADSLLYRICWKPKSKTLAIHSMETFVNDIIRDTNAVNAYVFVKGHGNFRFAIDVEYKAHRNSSIDPDMKERINELYEFCREAYVACDDAEADDYAVIQFNTAIAAGRTAVLAHVDKDLNMAPGMHYNYVTKKHYIVEPEDGHAFLMTQLITGDAADNIKGIYGLGPAKAKKLLGGLKNKEMLPKVLETWQAKQGSVWKDNFVKCANLIFIRPREGMFRALDFEELCHEFEWEGDGKPYPSLTGKLERLLCDRISSQSGLLGTGFNGQPRDSV